MKKFTIFWLDGKTSVLEGTDIANAFTSAGYGAGALRAVDFYEEGENEGDWIWNGKTRNWDWTDKKRAQILDVCAN